MILHNMSVIRILSKAFLAMVMVSVANVADFFIPKFRIVIFALIDHGLSIIK